MTVTVVVRVSGVLRQGDSFANSAQVFSDKLNYLCRSLRPTSQPSANWLTFQSKNRIFRIRLAVAARWRYQLLVHNNGPSDAVNVIVTDTLPAAVTFLQATLGFNCSEGPADVIVCSLPVLRAGESKLIEILVDVADNLADGSVITNTAYVSSNSNETNLLNNVDQITTTIESGTD